MPGKGWKCTLSKNKTNMGKQNMARAESAAVKYHILQLHNYKKKRKKNNFKKEEIHIKSHKEKDRRCT
jgi:hypothetical protein